MIATAEDVVRFMEERKLKGIEKVERVEIQRHLRARGFDPGSVLAAIVQAMQAGALFEDANRLLSLRMKTP